VLGSILAAAHAGALVIGVSMPLHWAARLTLLGLISINLYHSVRRYALHKGERAIHWAELEGDGNWHLGLANADTLGPCSVKGYYAKPWLIIIRLACRGTRSPLSLVVAPDVVDPETFKNLRVRLNLESPNS
jgi:hypothetical protein